LIRPPSKQKCQTKVFQAGTNPVYALDRDKFQSTFQKLFCD